MKQFTSKSFQCFKTLNMVPYYNFVRLDPIIQERMKQYEKPQRYYKDLINEAPSNARGFLKIEPSHLSKMISLSSTEEDVELLVKAYYNFLGHRVKFENKVIDNLVMTAVNAECPHLCFDILRNHNLIQYYPHSDVLDAIADFYVETEDVERSQELLEIFKGKNLLKFTANTLNKLLKAGNSKNDFASEIFELLSTRSISITPDVLKSMINTFYKNYEKDEKLDDSSKALADRLIAKASEVELETEYYFMLAQSQLDINPAKAFKILNDVAEKIKLTNKNDFALSNSKYIIRFMQCIPVAAESNKTIEARFNQTVEKFETNFGEQAFAKNTKQNIEKIRILMRDDSSSDPENSSSQ